MMMMALWPLLPGSQLAAPAAPAPPQQQVYKVPEGAGGV